MEQSTNLRKRKKHAKKSETRKKLHDLCHLHLMSRKLEERTQQLVSMERGFTKESSMIALTVNQCNLVSSIQWLSSNGSDSITAAAEEDGGTNLMDLRREFEAWIECTRRSYSCSKRDVQRAVIESKAEKKKVYDELAVKISVRYLQNEREKLVHDAENYRQFIKMCLTKNTSWKEIHGYCPDIAKGLFRKLHGLNKSVTFMDHGKDVKDSREKKLRKRLNKRVRKMMRKLDEVDKKENKKRALEYALSAAEIDKEIEELGRRLALGF